MLWDRISHPLVQDFFEQNISLDFCHSHKNGSASHPHYHSFLLSVQRSFLTPTTRRHVLAEDVVTQTCTWLASPLPASSTLNSR